MRHLLGVVTAAAAAAFGGLVLGEYELKGAMVVVAAVLFGLAVAEVLVAIARRTGPVEATLAGVLTALGFAWSSWIQSGRDWEFVSGVRWLGVPIGVVAAAAWVRSSGRRAVDSRAEP
jgi:ABC-type Mn2+/Zn2+ transport system permease subunit